MGKRIVIIGAGHAGTAAAGQLRRRGFSGDIILLSAERELPYQRPPLSKGFLASTMEADRLRFRNVAFYQEKEIDLKQGEAAVSLDTKAQKIKTSAATYDYDKVILATGGSPRALEGCTTLQNFADCLSLREKLAQTSELAIIGGGYIGLEVAATARKLGVAVKLFEAAPRILSRTAAPEIAAFFTNTHKKHGVIFHLDTQNTPPPIQPQTRPLVLAGIGMTPNVELALAAGLKIDNGIVVNEVQQTSNQNIYAIGDCALAPHPLYGRSLRLESVQNANYQADIVASTLCGEAPPSVEVPWFWSDQYDIKLQIAGLSQGYDRTLMRGNPKENKFVLFYIAADKVIAADCINSPQEFMFVKQTLTQRKLLALDKLSDISQPLKNLLAG